MSPDDWAIVMSVLAMLICAGTVAYNIYLNKKG